MVTCARLIDKTKKFIVFFFDRWIVNNCYNPRTGKVEQADRSTSHVNSVQTYGEDGEERRRPLRCHNREETQWNQDDIEGRRCLERSLDD